MNLKEAVELWAEKTAPADQYRQLAEECCELGGASLHMIRRDVDRADLNALKGELADVIVMCLWASAYHGEEFDADVKRIVCEKMNRCLKRAELEERIAGYATYPEKEKKK